MSQSPTIAASTTELFREKSTYKTLGAVAPSVSHSRRCVRGGNQEVRQSRGALSCHLRKRPPGTSSDVNAKERWSAQEPAICR